MKQSTLIILISLGLYACKTKITDVNEPFPIVSEVPFLEFNKVNQTTIDNYGDLVFDVKYTDGDGDLGSYDADENTLFVVDERDQIVSSFHVIPLNPIPGEERVITGILSVNLDNVILLNDTANQETTQFTIYLYDQAGNKSNEIESPLITINR